MNSEREIENVVRAFETCETGADDFKHKDHLVVALWYVHNLGSEAALERMRTGLIRFLNHHEGDPKKYSEEITKFWIDRVDQRLNELGSEMSLVEKCNLIVESADFIYVK
ncbi:MAG TPA: hypothetical protein VF251_09175 [Pyrinomonadaceae bacterium]